LGLAATAAPQLRLRIESLVKKDAEPGSGKGSVLDESYQTVENGPSNQKTRRNHQAEATALMRLF
jgi:hypothetical protein